MEGFGVQAFVATMAILGVVIVVSALLSGVVERTGFPQVAVFLALGAILGPFGLGWADFPLESPWLRVIATIALVLVLFSDALRVDVKEGRRHGRLALLVLGPGTLLSAALLAFAAWELLEVPWAAAVILAAALASTDPVLLRGLLRRPDLPAPVRHALGLESGLNDGVLLPIVLVGMVLLAEGPSGGALGWSRRVFEVLVLGPAIGAAVGFVGVALLDWVRRRWGARRDYESLYALGIAFTAYAGAEALGGSGFLAAFASGLAVAALDVELCDCFLDYGQASAEMGLLFTFVAFGTSAVWSALGAMSGTAWLFVVVALLVRPAVLLAALARVPLDRRSRALIVWFGPRGLSALLLVLLPVFAGLPGSDQLFAITSVVVLVSVVIHGGSPMWLAYGPRRRQAESEAAPGAPTAASVEEPEAPAAAQAATATAYASDDREYVADRERITLEELQRLWRADEPVVLVDARSDRTWRDDERTARGALRLAPDSAVQRARELILPRQAWLVAYCACPNEETSLRVVRALQQAGWPRARALAGGWTAWKAAGLPVEPKGDEP